MKCVFFNAFESYTNTYIGIQQNQECMFNNSIRDSITPKYNKLTTIDNNYIRNALAVDVFIAQGKSEMKCVFFNASESNTNTYIAIRQNRECAFHNSIQDSITPK